MGLREQLTNMSPREQRLLTILGVLFGALIFLGLPIYIYSDLAGARDRNEEIREVLRRIAKADELLQKRKGERLALDLRYAKPAPALATFIEGAASANGLEVPESTDRPPVQGTGYTERITSVKLRAVGLRPFVQMLEKIERSGHPVQVSQLSIKTKASGPDLYDVSMQVSAFDKEGMEKTGADKDKTTGGTKK